MDYIKELLCDSEKLKKKSYILSQMYQERSKYEPAWEQLSKYIFPMRGRFYENGGNMEGQRRDLFMTDSYPMEAATKCAAGIHSGLTSPSRPWFEISLQDEEKAEFHPVRMWLDDCHDIMMGLFARNNTYDALYQLDGELVQFGTGACLMLQDYNHAMWHRSYTCGEYAGGVDARGKVCRFSRKMEMDAYQMIKEFGEEYVSEAVRSAYKQGNMTERFAVNMIIERNDKYDPDKPVFGGFKWRSYYWEDGRTDQFLRISGYHEQPFLMPRWLVIANEIYGVGPGQYAIGNCMQLQQIERYKLRATENDADPAMVFPSSMKKANTLPGSKNYVNDGVQMQAYPLVPPGAKRYEGYIMLSQDKRQQIDSAFYVDLMMMLASRDNPQMTAREVAERHEEKLLMLAPVLERQHGEVLEPLIMRMFGICHRNGLFPPMPEEIKPEELKINFVSLLAQAQRMVEVTSLEKTVGFVGNLVAVYPEARDIIDIDEAVRLQAIRNGTPESVMRSKEDVEAIRKQRAQAEAQAKQTEQLMAAGAPARDMAQAARLLADTPADGSNALEALLRGGI